jgi:hypothetical protein
MLRAREYELEQGYVASPTRRRADDPMAYDSIWIALFQRPRREDARAIQTRKMELGKNIIALSQSQAADLYKRLKVRGRNDDLSRAFYHALDSATIGRLLRILRLRRDGQQVGENRMRGILSPRRASREYEANAREYFVIQNRVLRIPEGHERLTRDAARGVAGISPTDLSALIEGVRRVDYGLTNHFKAGEQRRHALRSAVCQPLRNALSEIRNQLARLHGQAIRANTIGTRQAALGLIGEALHLIQDSFSPAHTERVLDGATNPIRYIRYFGLRGQTYPTEHRVFPAPDPRDIITASGGRLTPVASAAIIASRQFLQMMLRHLTRPTPPHAGAELRAFMDRHLVLSASPIEPRFIYRCP